MIRKLFFFILTLGLFLAACTAPEAPAPASVEEPVLNPVPSEEENSDAPDTTEGTVEEPAEVPEPEEEPVTEAEYPEPKEETTEEVEASGEAPVIDSDLPLLPVAQAGQAGGLGGGGGIAESSLADTSAIVGDAGLLLPEFYNPFEETNFIIAADMTGGATALPVFRQPELYPSYEAALAATQQFGFPLPLYQESLPAEYRAEIDQLGDGIYRVPFASFKGEEFLTIMSGNVFYENRAVALDYSGVAPDFSTIAPIADAKLAEWGGLPFEYTLVDEGYGSVSVRRMLNGAPLDYGEVYFTFNYAGELAFANYNVLTGLAPVGNYPITPAAQAWEEVLANVGQYSNRVWYFYEYNDDGLAIEPYVDPFADQYQLWQREFEPNGPISITGYPTVYMPVQDDSLPVVRMYYYDEFFVTGSPELMFSLAERQSGQVEISGTLAEDGKTIVMDAWSEVGYVDPIFYQGTIVREDMGAVLRTEFDGEYILLDIPEDIPNELEVYVYATSAETRPEFLFPVLDWETIERVIDYTQFEGDEGGLIEPMPIDGPYNDVITEFTVDSIELGYSYAPIWPEYDPNQEYVQPDWDFPAVLIVPTWIYSGVTDQGQRINFHAVAVDEAYFQAPNG